MPNELVDLARPQVPDPITGLPAGSHALELLARQHEPHELPVVDVADQALAPRQRLQDVAFHTGLAFPRFWGGGETLPASPLGAQLRFRTSRLSGDARARKKPYGRLPA